MESKEKYFKPIPITLPLQAASIKIAYPNFYYEVKLGVLEAVGEVKPTPLSTSYKVGITYTIGQKPIIRVLEPKLKSKDGKIPHTYDSVDTLCLYYPKYKEWTKFDYISETIIPWISLWLFYYEVWLITDKWLGGGIHPEPSKKKKKSNKA
jgi:hypothetical protein